MKRTVLGALLVVHPNIHFIIFVGDDWTHRETLEHESAAEKRIINLLEELISITKDPHEKKNASSLITFLKDRKRGFLRGANGGILLAGDQ